MDVKTESVEFSLTAEEVPAADGDPELDHITNLGLDLESDLNRLRCNYLDASYALRRHRLGRERQVRAVPVIDLTSDDSSFEQESSHSTKRRHSEVAGTAEANSTPAADAIDGEADVEIVSVIRGRTPQSLSTVTPPQSTSDTSPQGSPSEPPPADSVALNNSNNNNNVEQRAAELFSGESTSNVPPMAVGAHEEILTGPTRRVESILNDFYTFFRNRHDALNCTWAPPATHTVSIVPVPVEPTRGPYAAVPLSAETHPVFPMLNTCPFQRSSSTVGPVSGSGSAGGFFRPLARENVFPLFSPPTLPALPSRLAATIRRSVIVHNNFPSTSSVDTTSQLTVASSLCAQRQQEQGGASDVKRAKITYTEQQQPSTSKTADQHETISTAPAEQDQEEKETVCPICLETLSYLKAKKCKLMSTNCGHIFCADCVARALFKHKKTAECPICRTPLQNSREYIHPIFF